MTVKQIKDYFKYICNNDTKVFIEEDGKLYNIWLRMEDDDIVRIIKHAVEGH